VSGNAIDGVPADVAEAARDSISGAISAAAQLPAPLAGDLLIGARAAFTTGLNAVAAVSVALSVALAVLSALTLRHLRPLGDQTTVGEPDEATLDQANLDQATPAQAAPDQRIRPAPPAHRPPRCL
jgi:MFS transporter, DHA2 family, multidrug resistance protein